MRRAALLAPALALFAPAAQGCGAVEFESAAVVQEERLPDLRWRPVAGAEAYHVELTARVPEGPLVDRRVVRVETTAVELPRLDDARPTKLTLSVAAQCGRLQGPRAERMWLVMPSTRCAALDPLSVDAPTPGTRVLRWQVLAGQSVELRGFDARTGTLLSVRQSAATSEALTAGEPMVVAVRRLCSRGTGPLSYLYID